MLLAAADPVGDAGLLWRAAQCLGIERWAAASRRGRPVAGDRRRCAVSAAVPTLTNALGSYRAEGPQLDRLSLAYNLAAMDLWDDHALVRARR